MNRLSSPRHRQSWALTLALAVLLFTAWGQVHHVLHMGTVAVAAVDAGKTTAPGLADEEGSGVCKLLDQLAHGAGPVLTLPAVVQGLPMQASSGLPVVCPSGARPLGFEARGPPRLA